MRETETDRAKWPYGAMVFYGYFGSDSPGGRKLAVRTGIALVVVGASFIGLNAAASQFWQAVWVATMPAAVAFIGWSYMHYLRELDELSRLIQLQAFAVAYGAAMTLFFAALGVVVAFDVARAVPLLAGFVILAEPVRGLVLARQARKYS